MPGVFRDVAGPLAAGNPGTRLGLYVVDTGQLFVEGFLHEYRELSPEEQEARERRILREAAAGISSVLAGGQPLTRVGQTWDDHFLEALVPVRVGNRTAAVAWAEQRLHPVFAQRARTRLLLRYAALGTLTVGLVFTIPANPRGPAWGWPSASRSSRFTEEPSTWPANTVGVPPCGCVCHLAGGR
jgi:hypothetical protein